MRRGLKIRPSAKLRLQRRTAPDDLLLPLRTYELFPILQADYALGQATVLRFGIQGLPGWPHTFRNEEYPTGDFTARHYLFAIENRSHNRGFDLSLNLGFRASYTRFVAYARPQGAQLQRIFRSGAGAVMLSADGRRWNADGGD